MPIPPALICIAATTVLAVASSIALLLAGVGSPVAAAHLLFAVGILPLIFAAMIHFVAVLTRSAGPGRAVQAIPLLAQGVGVMVVVSMFGFLPRFAVYLGAFFDTVLAATLLAWMVRRATRCVGRPHPGWRGYALALGFLIVALLMILMSALYPGDYASWRLAHLHLNTLGFVGAAAFATLPVLLPTALGRADPEASRWLRTFWLPMLFGVALVAMGSATHRAALVSTEIFQTLGAACLLVLGLSLLRHWIQAYGVRGVVADGVACSLAVAVLGFILAIVFGGLHGWVASPARSLVLVWVGAFLLPLVTGALSQLLPVWRFPGPQTAVRLAMRARLARFGQVRSLFFLLGAFAIGLGQGPSGLLMLAAGAGMFLFSVVRAWRGAASI